MPGALLTDAYELTMLQTYLEAGMTERATFEFFVRRLPAGRNFLVAAGLEQLMEMLANLSFTPEELDWLEESDRFSRGLLEYLRDFRFRGDVDAMDEGTVVFANEPLVRVTASLPEAQLIESRLVNLMHFQTLIASKAARIRLVARDKMLIEFGMRRAHGAEAAILAARASYVAGFEGTSALEPARLFGIPFFGTMAHSFVQAHVDEAKAFERFARSHGANGVTLLIDTYDTEAGARKAVQVARALEAEGLRISGVRLDSGDLDLLSRRVRGILDRAGLAEARILASGSLEEKHIETLVAAGAPIDGFGVGTYLTTSADAPALDCVYKIQEYAGRPTRKRSSGKATLPGRKQVLRYRNDDGTLREDKVILDSEPAESAEALLKPVMRAGQRVRTPPSLERIRETVREELRRLPEGVRRLGPANPYPVRISDALLSLTSSVDREVR